MLFKKCVIAIGAVGGMALMSAAGCSSTANNGDAGPEAGDDTGVKVDSGKDTGKDTGVGMDSGPMCPTPGDVSAYTPPAFHPPLPQQDVCPDADIATYFTDCVDMYNQAKCTTFTTAHPTCATCLETLDIKDASWGASFDRGPYIFLNISGCVKHRGDAACAAAIQALDFCEDAACLADCWTNSGMMQADADALDKCWTAADAKGCKKYTDAANTACDASDAGSAWSLCKVASFTASYTPYAKLFCQSGG